MAVPNIPVPSAILFFSKSPRVGKNGLFKCAYALEHTLTNYLKEGKNSLGSNKGIWGPGQECS